MQIKKQVILENVEHKRMLSIGEVSEYISMGRSRTRQLMDQIGATRKVGGRVVFDKRVIDAYFDEA